MSWLVDRTSLLLPEARRMPASTVRRDLRDRGQTRAITLTARGLLGRAVFDLNPFLPHPDVTADHGPFRPTEFLLNRRDIFLAHRLPRLRALLLREIGAEFSELRFSDRTVRLQHGEQFGIDRFGRRRGYCRGGQHESATNAQNGFLHDPISLLCLSDPQARRRRSVAIVRDS
jgi:hypothetical protein